ncbi:hypothetical protein Tco_0256579 [Tanacetum coccineum]
MECQVYSLIKEAILLVGKSENLYEISSNKFWYLPPELSYQEEFEGLVTNFILAQEEKVHQFEEYISIIGNEFMQLSLKVVEKLKNEIRVNESKKFRKSQKSLCVKYICSIFPSPPLVRESTFGLKPGKENELDNESVKSKKKELDRREIREEVLVEMPREVPSFDEPESQPLPFKPNGLGKGRIKETHHLEHII